jgi:predicted lipoprotein with Yx(FWY)xxD motif
MATASNGTILVAAATQITLYTFNSDSPGVSNCSGGCSTTWPPLTAPSGQTPTAGSGIGGALATITRGDGSIQVTYKGRPLYFFHGDHQAGDMNGNYTGWSLARP